MLIYLPLMAVVAAFLFDEPAEAKLRYFDTNDIIGILLATAEVMAIAVFFGLYYMYPNFVSSKWFRQTSRASGWWKVNLVSDWTMTYLGSKGRFRKRFTCKYEGETNEKGLPDGLGRWIDDSFDGEVLTGNWKEGLPVAPFFSRHYGRGDAFSAVRIGYVMASDDVFTNNKFWPTNEKPPRCGIVSVECSVSGAFYNELPDATHLFGPYLLGTEWSIEELCCNLHHIGEEDDNNRVHIRAEPRGVQVKGYVYEATGQPIESNVDEVVVRINRIMNKPTKRQRWGLNYMPRTLERSFMLRDECVLRRDETGDSELSEADDIPKDEDQMKVSPKELEEASSASEHRTKISLSINGWVPSMHKEALVYFPGFNSCQKHSLETLGQFIAMTKLDSRVYPICFAWPNAQVLSYHSASRASATKRNRENLRQLLKGLQTAGIRTVHLMSHSMGVQTLVGAFEDNEDGSRSDVSLCFQLCCDSHPDAETNQADDNQLLYCKTLTMLNPDFPLDAFIDRGFRSIRRICSTITVVADRNDGALFWSELVNGIALHVGYQQPRALLSTLKPQSKRPLGYRKVVGKNVNSLHVLPDSDEGDEGKSELPIFRNRAPILLSLEDQEYDQLWLDMDMIDTTGLDTNIAGIRHSAFNINPILFKDLEELISTGRRASKRSALLYREGNIFSYCHAPSFVVME